MEFIGPSFARKVDQLAFLILVQFRGNAPAFLAANRNVPTDGDSRPASVLSDTALMIRVDDGGDILSRIFC